MILNLSYLVFYTHMRPELGSRRKQMMEKFNEFMLIICSYHLMFFTYFIQSLELQYILGYSFVVTVVAILLVSILNLLWVVFFKQRTAYRK